MYLVKSHDTWRLSVHRGTVVHQFPIDYAAVGRQVTNVNRQPDYAIGSN